MNGTTLSSIGKWSLALALGMVPAIALADAFAPGAWSHQTITVSADVPGVPQWMIKLFAGDKSRKSCFTAAQSASRPEALLTQDDAAVCKVRHFEMTGGKLIFDTFCTNKRFPDGLMVASKGSYTPRSYSISTLTTGTKDGAPVKIVTTGTGQWTGPACK